MSPVKTALGAVSFLSILAVVIVLSEIVYRNTAWGDFKSAFSMTQVKPDATILDPFGNAEPATCTYGNGVMRCESAATTCVYVGRILTCEAK